MTQTEHRRYAGQSAQERDEDRRRRLLDTAIELFGTEGYPAVSVERLCTAAKVSTRHFYVLYRNKEDALLDVYAAITSNAITSVGASLEENTGRPIGERLPAALRAYLGPILRDPRLARLAFVEVVGVSTRVEERRLEFRGGIVELIEHEGAEAVRRGEISDRDFRFVALALLGAINVVVHDWSLNADHAAAATLEQQLCDLASLLMGVTTTI